MLGPVTASFVFFFFFFFLASLRLWSLATIGLPAIALCPNRVGLWADAGLCDLTKTPKKSA